MLSSYCIYFPTTPSFTLYHPPPIIKNNHPGIHPRVGVGCYLPCYQEFTCVCVSNVDVLSIHV